jgi:hypothetical protein
LGAESVQKEYAFLAGIAYCVRACNIRLEIVDGFTPIDPFFWEEVIVIEQLALRCSAELDAMQAKSCD